MVDRSVARRKALLDALMPLWQEREAALKIIAGKEIAAVRGLACEPPTAEERDRFERAQAAVERALQRLRWFDYRHVARPVRGRRAGVTRPSSAKAADAADQRSPP